MFKRGNVRLMAAAVAAISLHALILWSLPSFEAMKIGNEQGVLQLELMAQQSVSDKFVSDKSVSNKPVSDKRPSSIPSKSTRSATVENVATAVEIKQQPANESKQQRVSNALPAALPIQPSPIIVTKASEHKAVFAPASKAVETASTKPKNIAPNIDVATKESKSLADQNLLSDQNPISNSISNPISNKSLNTPTQADSASNARAINAVPESVQTRILAEVHYPRQARRHGWQGKAEFQFDVQQQSIQTVTLLASTGYPILDRAAHRGLIAASHVALSNGLYRMPVVFRLQ
ncbi:TonB family protein [Mariprofundus ferrooxydans]|nr:TonB family protein [Mariprofundus ferrooxydans]